MTEKIDRYSSFTFDGEGYVMDHLTGRRIVKFNFPMSRGDEADELARRCVEWLNE